MALNGMKEEDDLSTLKVRAPGSTRVPVTVSSYKQPEQVIIRQDTSRLKIKESDMDINKIANIIAQWPNSDVWPFKFSLPIVGASCAATGFFINRTFRNALYLEHFAKLSSFTAVMGIPAFSCALFHGMVISANILSQKQTCPVCLQVNSAVIQLIFGLACPMVSAPLVAYSTAGTLKHLHFPNLKKHPGEVWDYTKSVFKPIRGHLGLIGAAQIIIGMGVTALEQNCFYTTILPVLQGKETFETIKSANKKINEDLSS